MTPPDEAIHHRGYTLLPVHAPPIWRVSILPGPAVAASVNLPITQDEDRERAIGRARDLVDGILDGPGLG